MRRFNEPVIAEGIIPNNFTTAPAPYSVLLQEIGVLEKELSFIVIGDSHAIDFANGLHIAALQKGRHGLFLNFLAPPVAVFAEEDTP